MGLSKRSRCKSCNAEIYWIKMGSSGKWMPVDPDRQAIVCCDADMENGHVQNGYVSHYATCPNANQHRKRK